jgi:predicted acetyltransferase
LAALPRYVAALEAGWSPDNIRGQITVDEHLAAIDADAAAFVASWDDPDAKRPPLRAPNGELMQRIPGFTRRVWDGDFCGTIGFRWQKGTPDLPPHVLGHIGYAIVPWKRGLGHATAALGLLLPEAWRLQLPYVDLTTDPGNLPSQKVILANGGMFMGRYAKPALYGGAEGFRFRILAPGPL